MTGNIALMGILYGVDTTVGAAERVAQAAIFLSHSLTTYGINAADATMERTGAAESIEKNIWNKMNDISAKLQWQDHTDAIARIIGMVTNYTIPLSNLSKTEISNCIKRYALLQQSNRLMVVLPIEKHTAPSEDLARCMGLAAAAYGKLAINFQVYLPQMMYQSDILSHLAPGITAADVILESQQDSVFQPGYMLIIDHKKKDIVLSIRGTMNPHDVLTDLACHHTPCHEHISANNGTDSNITPKDNNEEIGMSKLSRALGIDEADMQDIHFAHDGFLQSALRLDKFLLSEITSLRLKYNDYGVLLCGHSLGAGVASLLTILWSKHFPDIR